MDDDLLRPRAISFPLAEKLLGLTWKHGALVSRRGIFAICTRSLSGQLTAKAETCFEVGYSSPRSPSWLLPNVPDSRVWASTSMPTSNRRNGLMFPSRHQKSRLPCLSSYVNYVRADLVDCLSRATQHAEAHPCMKAPQWAPVGNYTNAVCSRSCC